MSEKEEDQCQTIVLPFSGRIIDLRVSEGDHVNKGEELFTVEAFKLENLVFSKQEGKITKINAVVGQDMKKGEIVVELQII